MFKLNLKIAFRNLWKDKMVSLINIIGLATGLAACVLLLLYANYELSYDRQGRDSNKVYQVMTNFQDAEGKITNTGGSAGDGIAEAIREEIPQVDKIARVGGGDRSVISNKQKLFKRKDFFADPQILDIFQYEFIVGNPKTALNSPDGVILTSETAKLLFGTVDVLGRVVRYKNSRDLKVTGVIKDLPKNMSLRFDYLMSWDFFKSINDYVRNPGWGNFNFLAFAKVDEPRNIDFINSSVKKLFNENYKDQKAENFLFPFSDIHLHGEFLAGRSIGGAIERVYLFIGLGLGILLIACINFMNLATARSARRAKEVGIKKTIGASRISLVIQFLMEAFLLTILSILIAIIIVETTLPFFNNLLEVGIQIPYSSAAYWMGILLVTLFTGGISGAYPAIYLSAFNPHSAIVNKNGRSNLFSVNVRQLLVVIQFSFAIVLLIATLVIYRQLQFIKNRPIGYSTSLLAEIPQDYQFLTKFEILKSQLINSGAAVSVNQSSQSMTGVSNWFYGLKWPGMEDKGKEIVFNRLQTQYDFLKTTGVELIEGRDFSKDFASDTAGVMLSQKAVKMMQLKKPLGKNIDLFGQKLQVIGVFKDFIWDSPYHSGRPMIINFSKSEGGNINVRLNPNNSLSHNVELIGAIAKNIDKDYPLEISFVDDLLSQKLQSEKVLGLLANVFGGIAILISCLGLYSLVSYSAEQRTKEFGVRRVLGASVASIIQLLSFSFLKMVLISAVISVPIAYFLMKEWLNGFEFQVGLSLSVFLISIFMTILIAFITVFFQAYKAATANPVSALKYE
ncbi:ABC transporter permease [Pedobacter jamesrossensis]|uniref:ABC transporter permease n=1 Tax=Pedobacter jamesrossensis TaxID=1908238 RepID=A0ABV8NSU3_9SPHI